MKLGLFLFGFMFFAAIVGSFFHSSEEELYGIPRSSAEAHLPASLKDEIEQYLISRNWDDIEVQMYNADKPDTLILSATATGKLHDFYKSSKQEKFLIGYTDGKRFPVNRQAEVLMNK